MREGESLDPFAIEFGSLLERTRKVLQSWGFWSGEGTLSRSNADQFEHWRQRLQDRFQAILDGPLRHTSEGEVLEMRDGRKIPLALASSGQQEAIPLLLLLARFCLVGGRRSVYVEEPEAHLFPSAQKEIVELLVETFNRGNERMRLIVTTHSPYLLTALNNLLKAGACYAETHKATSRISQIIPEQVALRPEHFAAYLLEGGSARSIIDPETGLIDGSAIDQTSEVLAETFHQILWGSK